MPTDPAILAQLQTLWGEPVTNATSEADAVSAFVSSEWRPSPVDAPTLPRWLSDAIDRAFPVGSRLLPVVLGSRLDSPGTWNAEAAELVGWFENSEGSLRSSRST